MGGIVGAGIFINPSVVAREVRTPALILGAWAIGGLVALAGAFVYAEVRAPARGGRPVRLSPRGLPSARGLPLRLGAAARDPERGHGGGGDDVRALLRSSSPAAGRPRRWRRWRWPSSPAVNCLGVRSGQQRAERADGAQDRRHRCASCVACCSAARANPPPLSPPPLARRRLRVRRRADPVLFAYGGWQTASFVIGRAARPRARPAAWPLLGVAGVVFLYLGVNFVCLRGARPRRPRGDHRPRLGRHAPRARRAGARLIALGDRDLDPRLPEPGHPDRAARLLRDGRGRGLLRARRPLHPRTGCPSWPSCCRASRPS